MESNFNPFDNSFGTPYTSFTPTGLNLERREKLHAFAVVAIDKTVPIAMLDQKIDLSLSLAYRKEEALEAVRQGFRLRGEDFNKYLIPFMLVATPVEELVNNFKSILAPASLPQLAETVNPKTKAVEDLCAYVSYVFGEVGTESEKEVANLVIARFRNAKK